MLRFSSFAGQLVLLYQLFRREAANSIWADTFGTDPVIPEHAELSQK